MYAALFAQAAGNADFQRQMELQQKLATTPVGIVNQVCGWGCLICTIIIIVLAFMKGSTGLGVGGIVATLACCCPGIVMTLIVGWVKSGQWRIMPLMLIYTLLFVGMIVTQIMLSMQVSELMKTVTLLM